MIAQSNTEWPDLNGFRNFEHIMQRFHITLHLAMIALNESSIFGLVCTSVTNDWIVYQIVGAVVVKKAT